MFGLNVRVLKQFRWTLIHQGTQHAQQRAPRCSQGSRNVSAPEYHKVVPTVAKTRILMDHLHVAQVLFYNQWLFSNPLVVDASMHPRWWWYRTNGGIWHGFSQLSSWVVVATPKWTTDVLPFQTIRFQLSLHVCTIIRNEATKAVSSRMRRPFSPKTSRVLRFDDEKSNFESLNNVIKRVLNEYTPITTVSDSPENYCGSFEEDEKVLLQKPDGTPEFHVESDLVCSLLQTWLPSPPLGRKSFACE